MNKTGLFLSFAFFAAAPLSTAETVHSSGKGRAQVKKTEITQRHTKKRTANRLPTASAACRAKMRAYAKS